MDVAAKQCPAAIFRNQVVAVIDQLRCARSRGRDQPAEWVIGEDGEARAVGRARARADQAVLGVVAVEGAARLGEVAVVVVGEARASRRGVLVEAVDRVGRDVGRPGSLT